MYTAAPPTGIGVVGGVLATTGSEQIGFILMGLALLLGGAVVARLSWLKRQRALGTAA
ncbi:LPXTG cell wall anchor domain-containing protein [Leucobacter sp. HNU]|uniref:LPXTG cell wall anchor domain-containing protein n=1 Tax=Leucobacter sp. HNU TaxID=3236805 RepID=UPI003A8123DF